MDNIIHKLIQEFYQFAKKQMKITETPKVFLIFDSLNAKDPLGKTGFYDPKQKSISIFAFNRHPKDVLRSFSHELTHHEQNCNGMFNLSDNMSKGYAQKNEHLRKMEADAYKRRKFNIARL